MGFMLIASILFNLLLGFLLIKAVRRCETLENLLGKYVAKLADIESGIHTAITNMRNVDIRGAFEATDEVGDVFKILHNMVESLTQFLDDEHDVG